MPVYKAISYDEREGFAGGGARRSRHSRASRGLRGSDRDRGGPDRRAGGLPAGGLTKRQKEAIADAQRQKNLQREAQRERDKLNELRLAKEAQVERDKLNELRLAKEAEAERQKLKRMADLKAQQEADLAAQKAAAQASMGPQGLGTIVPEGETYSAKTAFEEVMDKNPNIDFMGATPETVKRDIFGNIYTEDDQRLGSMGEISDLGGLGTIGAIGTSALDALGVDLSTPTFTANEAYQRDMARERGGPDRRAIDTRGGFAKFVGDKPIVKYAPRTGDFRDYNDNGIDDRDEGYVGINPRRDTKPTGAIDYSNVGANTMSIPVVNPISAQRTSTNLRDYYARLLGQDPAMYAANGGRVGRMSGGMMIMGDNGVVNNGIGGIMKKYQRIRSEL